jgi:uncharacterized protein
MSNSNKDIVMTAWKKFSTRDPAVIEACFTEDAAWIVPERNATALALGRGEVKRLNRQEIVEFVAHEFGRVFVSGVNIEIKGVYGDGDTVVVEQRFSATIANGNAYQNDYCFVFKVHDGKIAEMREYMDTLSGFRQIFGEESVGVVDPLVS